jgi:hypothetical protein
LARSGSSAFDGARDFYPSLDPNCLQLGLIQQDNVPVVVADDSRGNPMLQNLIHALARRSYEVRPNLMGQVQLELQTERRWGTVATRLS